MSTEPYAVRFAGRGADRVRQLLRAALRVGRFDRVRAAPTRIERALAADPTTWGDPLRRFPATKLTVYHRIYDDIYVTYIVHDTARVVWITRAAPVFNHPRG